MNEALNAINYALELSKDNDHVAVQFLNDWHCADLNGWHDYTPVDDSVMYIRNKNRPPMRNG